MVEFETVECCPHCDFENVYADYSVIENNYIATCQSCGKRIFLCDECQHAEDNQGMKCDWDNGKCFRGECKNYGKSFKQWLKEAESNIVKLGYSEQYANAVVCGLRNRYTDKYNFQDPKTITPYS